MKKLLAYHSDPAIKAKYVVRMKAHIEADELIKGFGFKYNSGCAVGCTLNDYNHSAYETELGIPECLAYVEDAIFEGLSTAESTAFALEFLEAIEPGADLELVFPKFMVWLLVDPEFGMINLSKSDNNNFSNKIINEVAQLYEKWILGKKPIKKSWLALQELAEEAAIFSTSSRNEVYGIAYAVAAETAVSWFQGYSIYRAIFWNSLLNKYNYSLWNEQAKKLIALLRAA